MKIVLHNKFIDVTIATHIPNATKKASHTLGFLRCTSKFYRFRRDKILGGDFQYRNNHKLNGRHLIYHEDHFTTENDKTQSHTSLQRFSANGINVGYHHRDKAEEARNNSYIPAKNAKTHNDRIRRY